MGYGFWGDDCTYCTVMVFGVFVRMQAFGPQLQAFGKSWSILEAPRNPLQPSRSPSAGRRV